MLDRHTGALLATDARRALLDGLPVMPVPVLAWRTFGKMGELTLRGKLSRLLRAFGARIEILCLEIPREQLHARNRVRAAALPAAALGALSARLEPAQPLEAHAVTHILLREDVKETAHAMA